MCIEHHFQIYKERQVAKSKEQKNVYMYMQILVAMGIQWGHGLSKCTYVYWGWWCQISWNIKVLSKIIQQLIILRCSMTFGQGIIL